MMVSFLSQRYFSYCSFQRDRTFSVDWLIQYVPLNNTESTKRSHETLSVAILSRNYSLILLNGLHRGG